MQDIRQRLARLLKYPPGMSPPWAEVRAICEAALVQIQLLDAGKIRPAANLEPELVAYFAREVASGAFEETDEDTVSLSREHLHRLIAVALEFFWNCASISPLVVEIPQPEPPGGD